MDIELDAVLTTITAMYEAHVPGEGWGHLDRASIEGYADGSITEDVLDHLEKMYPKDLLLGLSGKDVLCLASSGGEQTAVFGLLGARVSSFDLADPYPLKEPATVPTAGAGAASARVAGLAGQTAGCDP